MIRGVLAQDVDKSWLFAEPLLAKACRFSYDGITTEILRKWIQAREAQLWVNEDTAFITRIVLYPHCKALQLVSCGGKNLKCWAAEAQSLFETYARFHGCRRLEIIGRPGWERVFRDLSVVSKIMTKELA